MVEGESGYGGAPRGRLEGSRDRHMEVAQLLVFLGWVVGFHCDSRRERGLRCMQIQWSGLGCWQELAWGWVEMGVIPASPIFLWVF